jgi:hypothetical protein
MVILLIPVGVRVGQAQRDYLYLTQRLLDTPPAERRALTEVIARSSPVSWQHINMQGEFDFSEEALSEALRFDLAELVSFE